MDWRPGQNGSTTSRTISRGFMKQNILDWTPVNSARSQGEFEIKRPLDATLAIGDHSDCDSNGKSSESTIGGDCYVGTTRKLLKNHFRSTKRAKQSRRPRILCGAKNCSGYLVRYPVSCAQRWGFFYLPYLHRPRHIIAIPSSRNI